MSRQLIDEPVSLDLGGTVFNFVPTRTFVLNDPLNSYKEFVSKKAPSEGGVSISVDDQINESLLAGEEIFDADGAWRLLSSESRKCFVGIGPSALRQPPWILECSGSRMVVHGSTEVRDSEGDVVFPMMYPVDQLICINAMASNDGALVHCAGVRVGDGVYLFAGRSGAGKSTLSECVCNNDGIEVISDDRMIVRLQEAGSTLAYGTPWPGDAGIALNTYGPVKGIFFLEHGDTNEIRAIGCADAFERLVSVVSVPWYDERLRDSVMVTLQDLLEKTDKAIFKFSPKTDVGAFLTQNSGG